jgi:hypothetical protein
MTRPLPKSELRVWVLVTYHGSGGEDVFAFRRREDAEARAMEYIRDRWPERLGDAPSTYDGAEEAWNAHGLWEAYDSRWELVEVPAE